MILEYAGSGIAGLKKRDFLEQLITVLRRFEMYLDYITGETPEEMIDDLNEAVALLKKLGHDGVAVRISKITEMLQFFWDEEEETF
jgi:hypothetical protein